MKKPLFPGEERGKRMRGGWEDRGGYGGMREGGGGGEVQSLLNLVSLAIDGNRWPSIVDEVFIIN